MSVMSTFEYLDAKFGPISPSQRRPLPQLPPPGGIPGSVVGSNYPDPDRNFWDFTKGLEEDDEDDDERDDRSFDSSFDSNYFDGYDND